MTIFEYFDEVDRCLDRVNNAVLSSAMPIQQAAKLLMITRIKKAEIAVRRSEMLQIGEAVFRRAEDDPDIKLEMEVLLRQWEEITVGTETMARQTVTGELDDETRRRLESRKGMTNKQCTDRILASYRRVEECFRTHTSPAMPGYQEQVEAFRQIRSAIDLELEPFRGDDDEAGEASPLLIAAVEVIEHKADNIILALQTSSKVN